MRFYVTLTWDNWPEGGSYGAVVEAKDHEAEDLVRNLYEINGKTRHEIQNQS